ncbi:hypothetical protein EK904_014177 [Melospiza melodia maxima]|nr:hypothetical protein EK904_014177 [Melospiza melodia maxima]
MSELDGQVMMCCPVWSSDLLVLKRCHWLQISSSERMMESAFGERSLDCNPMVTCCFPSWFGTEVLWRGKGVLRMLKVQRRGFPVGFSLVGKLHSIQYSPSLLKSERKHNTVVTKPPTPLSPAFSGKY